MSDNEERLKNLVSGNERPPAKANPPVTNQGSATNNNTKQRRTRLDSLEAKIVNLTSLPEIEKKSQDPPLGYL
jgi:hypothetical protein